MYQMRQQKDDTRFRITGWALDLIITELLDEDDGNHSRAAHFRG
jgi:hypothetical protein